MAKHPRKAEKLWAATAGAAAVGHAAAGAALQQPLPANGRQVIPPSSKQSQIKYTGICVCAPLQKNVLSCYGKLLQ